MRLQDTGLKGRASLHSISVFQTLPDSSDVRNTVDKSCGDYGASHITLRASSAVFVLLQCMFSILVLAIDMKS